MSVWMKRAVCMQSWPAVDRPDMTGSMQICAAYLLSVYGCTGYDANTGLKFGFMT